MSALVTIAEASSYLGVSKATLRNWDREGKLRATRHPFNDYRCYPLAELRRFKEQMSLLGDEPTEAGKDGRTQIADAKAAKRLVAKLHNILRDKDGDSSLLQRFDELTKLLFLKLFDTSGVPRATRPTLAPPSATTLRDEYARLAAAHPVLIPVQFATLRSSDSALAECAQLLATVTIDSTELDVKGLAYEEVIRNTFDKNDNQQFFTPQQVVAFACQMLRRDLSGVVMDPACGTGGFLVELVKNGATAGKLIGVEIDERLGWVAGINLLAHGATAFEVRRLNGAGSLGNGLDDLDGTVGAILTNPPFGSDLSDEEVLCRYSLGSGRTSRRRGILFLERCAKLLRPDGVVAIILDEGVLNLPSSTDVRRFILDNFDVLAIVSLPETAFLPYASVAASILFLKKSSLPGRNTRVFFARADNIGRRLNGDDDIIYDDNGTSRVNSDLPAILEQWNRHSSGITVEASELWYCTDVHSNLREEATLRLDFRFHHPSREMSKRLLRSAQYPLVPLSELCTEVTETVIPSTELTDQTILYTGLANIEAHSGVAFQTLTATASLKSAVKAYRPGDILFARMRPNLRKVALATFPSGGFCSPECVVLRVRRDKDDTPAIDAELLSVLLRSDLVFGQILHLVAGIGRPRLNTTDLRKVLVPVPPVSDQSHFLQQFRANLASARELRAQAQQLQQRATVVAAEAVNELATRVIGGAR